MFNPVHCQNFTSYAIPVVVQTDQCKFGEIRNLDTIPSYGLKTTTHYIALQRVRHNHVSTFISRLTIQCSEPLEFSQGQLPSVNSAINTTDQAVSHGIPKQFLNKLDEVKTDHISSHLIKKPIKLTNKRGNR